METDFNIKNYLIFIPKKELSLCSEMHQLDVEYNQLSFN